MTLHILTFSDRELGPDNALVESCARRGLPLRVLRRPGRWPANAVKIGMLHRHLAGADHAAEDVVFVVDAFDVVVEGDAAELAAGFEAFGADIVFSAEANFYFADKQLRGAYLASYPPGDGPYRFLNSGTFAGRAGTLGDLVAAVCRRYGVDPADDDQLRRIRSDQYLYSRYYADQAEGVDGPEVRLDHHQALFGCAGGRMFVEPTAPPPGPESFLAFRAARTRLRRAGLLRYQDGCVDLAADGDRFVNRLTGTRPPVLHLPGTHRHFARALRRLRTGAVEPGLLRPLAVHLENAGKISARRELTSSSRPTLRE